MVVLTLFRYAPHSRHKRRKGQLLSQKRKEICGSVLVSKVPSAEVYISAGVTEFRVFNINGVSESGQNLINKAPISRSLIN